MEKRLKVAVSEEQLHKYETVEKRLQVHAHKIEDIEGEHKHTQEQITWLTQESAEIQNQLKTMNAQFAERQQYFENWLSDLTANTRDAVQDAQQVRQWAARKANIVNNPLSKAFCIHLALALRFWVATSEVGAARQKGLLEKGAQSALGFLGDATSFFPGAGLLFKATSKIVEKVGDWKHEKAQAMTRQLFVLQKSGGEICDQTAITVTEQAMRFYFFTNVGNDKKEQEKNCEKAKKHAEKISSVLIYCMGREYLAQQLEQSSTAIEERFAQLLVECDVFQNYAKKHIESEQKTQTQTLSFQQQPPALPQRPSKPVATMQYAGAEQQYSGVKSQQNSPTQHMGMGYAPPQSYPAPSAPPAPPPYSQQAGYGYPSQPPVYVAPAGQGQYQGQQPVTYGYNCNNSQSTQWNGGNSYATQGQMTDQKQTTPPKLKKEKGCVMM